MPTTIGIHLESTPRGGTYAVLDVPGEPVLRELYTPAPCQAVASLLLARGARLRGWDSSGTYLLETSCR